MTLPFADGGRIWVESELGRGSTFHFTARFGSPQVGAGRTLDGARCQRGGESGPFDSSPKKGLHVLIAEDNAVNQMLVSRLLEKPRHTAVVVSTGKGVLAALDREPFDVVLMALQMPEMGGCEATAAIRERERSTGAHIPIIHRAHRLRHAGRSRAVFGNRHG